MDNTQNKIKKELKNFLIKVNERFNINEAILFGSRARGDSLDISDVDLIIVSDDFSDIPFRKRMAEVIEFWEGDVDLEVICYTRKEFNKLKERIGLVKTAVEEGIELF